MLIKVVLRLLLLSSQLRKNFVETTIFDYDNFLNHILLLCYFSIFYFYIFEGVYLLNIYVFYIILIIDLIFLLFIEQIYLIFSLLDEKYLDKFVSMFDIIFVALFLDPTDYKFSPKKLLFFECHNLI